MVFCCCCFVAQDSFSVLWFLAIWLPVFFTDFSSGASNYPGKSENFLWLDKVVQGWMFFGLYFLQHWASSSICLACNSSSIQGVVWNASNQWSRLFPSFLCHWVSGIFSQASLGFWKHFILLIMMCPFDPGGWLFMVIGVMGVQRSFDTGFAGGLMENFLCSPPRFAGLMGGLWGHFFY